MSRTEAELAAQFTAAGQMPHGEGQTSAMEDVVRHADAGGYLRLAFAARRGLADAYCYDRQWDKAFPLFARCLSEYDQRPGEYGAEEEWQLREWYAWMAMTMAEFPEITLAQVHGALDDVTARVQAGGHSLREVHAARRAVAQFVGDWDEEDRCYRMWQAAGGPAARQRQGLRGRDRAAAAARATTRRWRWRGRSPRRCWPGSGRSASRRSRSGARCCCRWSARASWPRPPRGTTGSAGRWSWARTGSSTAPCCTSSARSPATPSRAWTTWWRGGCGAGTR